MKNNLIKKTNLAKEEKELKLAQKLRENLLKRKAQMKIRKNASKA